MATLRIAQAFAISLTLLALPSPAAADFVDDVLQGRGYCAPEGPVGVTNATTSIDLKAPFGKPAADWTPSEFGICRRPSTIAAPGHPSK